MSKEFLNYIAASYPILWIDTQEYERAINNLSKTVTRLGHKCYKWDIISGITCLETGDTNEQTSDDPNQPIEFLENKNKTVIFVQDYHLYIKNEMLWRKLLNSLNDFKSSASVLVIVSPIVNIPPEIDRYISILDFNLPSIEELTNSLKEICQDMDIEIPENSEEIVNSGLGLTTFEFENSICLSIATHDKIFPAVVHKQKEQLIRKNSSLQVNKSNIGFDTLYGLDNLKYFAKKMVGKGKGVLIVGVPGGGKSHFANTLGYETNRLTINWDFGAMMGSLVGETERLTREGLKTVDAMEPCILFIDEIEKGLAGVSGYNGDSGTSQRQGGQFLKWLSDHTSDVYVIATSNDISKLPPEYLRAERWDAIFFVDLPNDIEREGITELYRKQFGIESNEKMPNIVNWTGAEIKTLCKLASNLEISLEDAAEYVTPLYKTMKEKIDSLREWSKDRTIPASKMVSDNKTEEKKVRRRQVQKVNQVG